MAAGQRKGYLDREFNDGTKSKSHNSGNWPSEKEAETFADRSVSTEGYEI